MGLFSTLTANADGRTTTSSSSQSSSSLPTVVQLYVKDPLQFEEEEDAVSYIPPHALLSYSAVSLQGPTEPPLSSIMVAPAKKKPHEQLVVVPELGVWNLRIPTDANFHMVVSNNLPSNSHTFALTVDLNEPNTVEPTITMMQNALIRYLKTRDADSHVEDDVRPHHNDDNTNNNTSAATTTSLFDLQLAQFGRAPNETTTSSSTTTTTITEPDKRDRNTKLSLILLAKLPTTKTSLSSNNHNQDTDYEARHYKNQQVQALLTYHLHKFACQLRAYLVFVKSSSSSDDDGEKSNNNDDYEVSTSSNNHNNAMTRRQVGVTLKQLAQNQLPTTSSPSQGEGDTTTDDENAPTSTSPVGFSIYAPDNVDVIDSILLRNASYPGQWDASTTSLWTIVPPPPQTSSSLVESANNNSKTSSARRVGGGDEAWLKELRDSVLTLAEKTPVKAATTSTQKKKEAAATPEAENVTSYFASLLG